MYFDQTYFIWFMQLAFIANVSDAFLGDYQSGLEELPHGVLSGGPQFPNSSSALVTCATSPI
jgi:hypothetical protein